MTISRGSQIRSSDLVNVRGDVSSTTAYASATLAQNKLAACFGVGFGDRGYGQTVPVITAVTPRQRIQSVDYTSLISSLNTCATHLGINLQLPNTSEFLTGEPVRAGTTNWAQLVNQVDELRLTPDPSHMVTTVTLTNTRVTKWTTSVILTFRTQFDTENQARFFFNSGGTINFVPSLTGGTNAISTDWATMLQSVGTVRLGARTITHGGQTTAQGFYNLSTSFRSVFIQRSAQYTANTLEVMARVGERQAQNGGNGRFVEIQVMFTNGVRTSVLDFVDGTLSVVMSVTKTQSPLQITSPFMSLMQVLSQGGDPPQFVFTSIITGQVRNYNLLSAAQAAGYSGAMISAQIPLVANVTVDANAVVGSTTVSTPALQVPSLPVVNSTVQITNRGTVVGKGGTGGAGGAWVAPSNINGEPGGTGVQINWPTTLINQGLIGGGGGGGGGSTTTFNIQTYDDPGGSGGGGAGADVGLPGGVGPNNTYLGQPGSLTTGGEGGFTSPNGRSREWALGFPGGRGGDLGQAGGAGAGDYGAGVGGSGGVSVQGVSLLNPNSVLPPDRLRGITA
jgi:hypothetical protein